MAKIFSDIIISKKLDSISKIRNYLVGKVATVINQNDGHNYGNNGDSFLISSKAVMSSRSMKLANDGIGNNIQYSSFTINDILTEKDIVEFIEKKEKELEELNLEISKAKEKIEYIKDFNLDVFKENEYKMYKSIQALEDEKISVKEKTKIIFSIINS